jgi:hypothetical protein
MAILAVGAPTDNGGAGADPDIHQQHILALTAEQSLVRRMYLLIKAGLWRCQRTETRWLWGSDPTPRIPEQCGVVFTRSLSAEDWAQQGSKFIRSCRREFH